MPDVTVACENLRLDAAKWATTATELAKAATAAEGLTLGIEQFGTVPFLKGLGAAYHVLQTRLSGILQSGAAELGNLSGTLLQVANTYEQEDREGAHQITEAGS